jgi:two-component system chemotaxis sensor kinase CheA
MDSHNLSSYKDLYVKTAREFLTTAHAKLPAYAATPKDMAILDELIRSAHSVKGQSLTMGFVKTGNLALLLETVLRKLKEDAIQLSPELLALIGEAFNALTRSIDTVEAEDKEADLADTIKKFEALKV